MKTKTSSFGKAFLSKKRFALVGIAIVLCSVFLVALPAIAAEQNQEMQKMTAGTITTASEDDYVLGVYGNANEDDTIDMRDLTYVKLIFFGKKPETEFADAKYDGKINPLDFIQIKLIIVGKEKELTIIDTAERTVTVPQPLEEVVVLNLNAADAMRALDAEGRLVGISGSMKDKPYWGELSKKPVVGGGPTDPNYEMIAELHPQVVITYGIFQSQAIPNLEEKLNPLGIAVVGLDFLKPEIMNGEFETLGYILDKEEEAHELIEFYNRYAKMIRERVEDIESGDRVQVYIEASIMGGSYYTGSKVSGWGQMVTLAGGKNLAEDLPGAYPIIDAEWVLDQNPVVIAKFVGYNAEELGYTVSSPTMAEETIKEVFSRPGWNHIDAVENKRVYLCSWHISCNPQYIIGLVYLAKWFYPEEFQDLNPEAVHKEYFEFIGMDYQGIWAYPPP